MYSLKAVSLACQLLPDLDSNTQKISLLESTGGPTIIVIIIQFYESCFLIIPDLINNNIFSSKESWKQSLLIIIRWILTMLVAVCITIDIVNDELGSVSVGSIIIFCVKCGWHNIEYIIL